MTFSVRSGISRVYSSPIPTATVGKTRESSVPVPPPPLPPAPRPLRLNAFRGRLSSVAGNRSMLQVAVREPRGLTIRIGIQHHDPDHAVFHGAVTAYVMRRSDAMLYLDSRGRMRIDAGDRAQPRDVEKAEAAIDEVRALVYFIQSIGGSLEHVCALLHDNDQARFIQDLFSLLGGDPENPKVDPEAVLRLSKALETRPDVRLALLDLALPQCPSGTIKSELAAQWIALATSAAEQSPEQVLFIHQVVLASLLRDPHLDLESRSALDALDRQIVPQTSDSQEPLSSVVGSPSLSADNALSTLTPGGPGQRSGVNRRTPLMDDCESGNLANVEELVERCMETDPRIIDEQDALGCTALMLACKNGHVDIVDYLLTMGANPNLPDNRGHTPLDWALRNDHERVWMALGGKGAKTRQYSTWAARRFGKGSRTSDEALSTRRSISTIDLRVEGNRRPTIDDLVEACRGNKLDVVRKCIGHGVLINAKDKSQQTPLHYACRDGNDPKIVELLVSRGALCESKDEGGNTPLMVACHKKKDALVGTLLRLGADANTTNNIGMTALMVASQSGCEDTILLLMGKGAELGIKCDEGRTALTYAAASGHLQIVEFLLSKGAVLDSKDNKGMTPLMHAARAGRTDVVERLLAWGADPDAKDVAGWTAGKHADANHHPLGKLGKSKKSRLKKIFS